MTGSSGGHGNEKVVVFEKLNYLFLPFLLIYMIFKYQIRYLEISPTLERTRQINRLLQTGRIKKIAWENFNIEKINEAHVFIRHNFESIWEETFQGSQIITSFQHLIKDDTISLAFKKHIIDLLFWKYCFPVARLNSIFNVDEYKKIVFIPYEILEVGSWKGSKERVINLNPQLDPRLITPHWAKVYGRILFPIFKGFQIGIILLLPIWIISRIRNIKKVPIKNYKIGIRIYNDDIGFRYKSEKIDFLVDSEKIKSKDVLFCNERDIMPEYEKEFEKRKYNLIPLQSGLKESNLLFIFRTIMMKYTKTCIQCCLFAPFEKKDIVFATNALLFYYPFWEAFLERYHFNNYVVYNNSSFTHILRNILLKKKGIKTWYYAHSNHQPDLFVPPNQEKLSSCLFWYLYYDNFISWGDKLTSFFKNERNNYAKFQNLGILWSELVIMQMKSGESDLLRTKVMNSLKGNPHNIIGVFDTSFGKESPLKTEDIEMFIEGLIRLLDEVPDIGIILKEKNLREEVINNNPEAGPAYERLKSHDKCYCTENPGDPDVEEVIGASDLVISACFTSPTTIALGARKKGIYYDAKCHFEGYYYDRIPGLVAKGYDELKTLVNYWLNEVTEKEFEDFLEEHVKGDIDAYVDGKAISRFRDMLVSES